MWRRKCHYCRCIDKDSSIDFNKLNDLRKQYSNLVLLDVRSVQEYQEGHMPGSICIPSYDILRVAEKIIPNKQTTIVTYCEYGVRSQKTANLLKKMGYKNVYNLKN